jgi:hypothetical protein
MSTAAAFNHHQTFPWGCVEDIEAAMDSIGASRVDNVSLADAMAFAWNLETFSFQTAGTATAGATTVSGNCNFTMSPISSDVFTEGFIEEGSMWSNVAIAPTKTPFASWVDLKPPNERVCMPSPTLIGASGCLILFAAWDQLPADNATIEMGFWVGTDPGNPGKYRIYYFFGISFQDVSDSIDLRWQNVPVGGSYSPVASGTFAIAGFSFDYYCDQLGATSTTGGTMTASSTLFTY